MWIVKDVPQESVVDPKSVAEVSRFECGIAYFASELGLKIVDSLSEGAHVEIVSNHKEVYLGLEHTSEEARERHDSQCPRALQSPDDMFRAQDGCLPDKACERRQGLEARIGLVFGFSSLTSLGDEAGKRELGELAPSRPLF